MPPRDRTAPPPADGYWLTVVPSYGRDYTTADKAAADWLAGKDFTIMDVSSPWDGAQTSRRDHPGANVTIKIPHPAWRGWTAAAIEDVARRIQAIYSEPTEQP